MSGVDANMAHLHDNMQVVVEAQDAGSVLAGLSAALGKGQAAGERIQSLGGRLLHARLQQPLQPCRLAPLHGNTSFTVIHQICHE